LDRARLEGRVAGMMVAGGREMQRPAEALARQDMMCVTRAAAHATASTQGNPPAAKVD